MSLSDLGSGMATLLTRGMVRDHFEHFAHATSIGATTHSGSVYLVDIKPGPYEPFMYEGYDYSVRAADATINGQEFADIYVGFNFAQGTILVLDEDYQRIRRSSSLARVELLD